jgi:uncharacterized membrane protein (DUF4010 family)
MALLMGLLIGIERQHSVGEGEPLFAGIRTFPLIVLIGYLRGLLTQAGFTWVLPVALAGTCALAGLADVDAFTISAAGLARQGVLAQSTAGPSILLAGAMNTLVKGGIAAVLGGPGLRRIILPIFGFMTLATVMACLAAARS